MVSKRYIREHLKKKKYHPLMWDNWEEVKVSGTGSELVFRFPNKIIKKGFVNKGDILSVRFSGIDNRRLELYNLGQKVKTKGIYSATKEEEIKLIEGWAERLVKQIANAKKLETKLNFIKNSNWENHPELIPAIGKKLIKGMRFFKEVEEYLLELQTKVNKKLP